MCKLVNGSTNSRALLIIHPIQQRFKSATSTFVSIQKQLIDHHFPASYNYQRIPSPWLQMKLLNIFANLGKDCRETSDYMYEIIRETMQRANSNSSAGHAIVYECIRTISTIYPCAPLLEEAAQRVSFFLYSNQNNLKYLGLNGVNMLVKVNAKYGDAHQLAVIECLESSDDTIKRKTLDLLVTISSPDNVEVITTKMLMYLQLTKDAFFQRDLVSRVVRCAEEHAPSRTWYIAKMVKLMLLGSKYIDERVVQNIMLILSEGYAGGGGDEEKTRQMRLFAVHEFLNAVQYKNAKQCPLLLQLAAWTIGEFGHLDPEMSVQEMILVVQDLLDVDYTMETRRWVMDALTKLNGRNGGKCPKEVVREFKKFENSKCVELQQICHEFGNMLREKDRELYKAAYPQDGARHIRRPTFSFLDDYAQAAVAAGKGKEYDNKLKESCAGLFDKPLLRAREGVEQDLDYQMPVLKFAAYETPSADPNEFRRTIPKRQQTEGDGEGDGGANNPLRLRPKGSKWTAEGYVPKAATSSSFTKKQVVQQSDLPSQLLAEGEESAARDAIARERKSPTVSPPSSLPSSPPPTAAVALNRPPSPADEKTKLARQLFGGKAANREKPRRAAGTSKSSNRRSSNTMAHQSARQSLEENNVPNDPASLSSEGAEFPEGESSSSRPLSPNSESESGSLIEQDGIEGESGQVKHLDGGDIDQGTGEQGIGEQASSSTRQSSDDLALLLNVDDPNVTPGSSSAPQSAPVTHGAGSNLLLPSSSFSEVVDTFVKKQIGEGRTSNIQTVVADNIAVISVQKLYYPEGPRLLIRVTSTAGVDGYGGGYLSNITLHLSSSDSISTSLEAPSLRHVTVSEEDRNVMTWNELAPDDTFVSCASVVISRVDMQMNIQGKLEYDAGKHSASAPASSKPSRSLSFTIKVLPSDIMRPLVVQNKEMGAVWSSLTQESRFEISPSVLVTTAKQFAKFLEEELNMFAGPVVKNESFGAGQLTDEGKSRVLMHCKVEGIKHLSLKLIIRAGNKLVLEMWMKYVQKLLSP